jgi:hypothetical protein
VIGSREYCTFALKVCNGSAIIMYTHHHRYLSETLTVAIKPITNEINQATDPQENQKYWQVSGMSAKIGDYPKNTNWDCRKTFHVYNL